MSISIMMGVQLWGGSKVPIKSRGSNHRAEEYGENILFLPFKPLALGALQATTGAEALTGDHANEAVRLLQCEAYGETLDGYELAWMDNLTEAVKAKVVRFAQPAEAPQTGATYPVFLGPDFDL